MMKIARSLVGCIACATLVLAASGMMAQEDPKDAQKEIAADKAQEPNVKDKARPKDAQKKIAADKAKKTDEEVQSKVTDREKEIAATIARRKARGLL